MNLTTPSKVRWPGRTKLKCLYRSPLTAKACSLNLMDERFKIRQWLQGTFGKDGRQQVTRLNRSASLTLRHTIVTLALTIVCGITILSFPYPSSSPVTDPLDLALNQTIDHMESCRLALRSLPPFPIDEQTYCTILHPSALTASFKQLNSTRANISSVLHTASDDHGKFSYSSRRHLFYPNKLFESRTSGCRRRFSGKNWPRGCGTQLSWSHLSHCRSGVTRLPSGCGIRSWRRPAERSRSVLDMRTILDQPALGWLQRKQSSLGAVERKAKENGLSAFGSQPFIRGWAGSPTPRSGASGSGPKSEWPDWFHFSSPGRSVVWVLLARFKSRAVEKNGTALAKGYYCRTR